MMNKLLEQQSPSEVKWGETLQFFGIVEMNSILIRENVPAMPRDANRNVNNGGVKGVLRLKKSVEVVPKVVLGFKVTLVLKVATVII